MTNPHAPWSAPAPPPPVPPRRRAPAWKILAIVAGAVLALCAGLVVLGLIVGPQPTKPAAEHPAAPAAAISAQPAPATTAAAPATSTRPPTTAAAPPTPTTVQPPAKPGAELCKVAEGGGVYYRWVTSASEHNFSACTGATVMPGTVDDLLAQSDAMDRRCILGDAATARFHAIVGVYSDTGSKNLAAARAYCKANGGELAG